MHSSSALRPHKHHTCLYVDPNTAGATNTLLTPAHDRAELAGKEARQNSSIQLSGRPTTTVSNTTVTLGLFRYGCLRSTG